MNRDLTFRDAQLKDAAGLAEIGRETFVETFGDLYPPGDLRQFLDETYSVDEDGSRPQRPRGRGSHRLLGQEDGRLLQDRSVQAADRYRAGAGARTAPRLRLPGTARASASAASCWPGRSNGRASAARRTSSLASGNPTNAPSRFMKAAASRRSAATSSRSATRWMTNSSCAFALRNARLPRRFALNSVAANPLT